MFIFLVFLLCFYEAIMKMLPTFVPVCIISSDVNMPGRGSSDQMLMGLFVSLKSQAEKYRSLICCEKKTLYYV